MGRRSNAQLARPGGPPSRETPGEPASPSKVKPPGRGLTMVICLCLAAAVWAVFGQTVWYGFINYDDAYYVYQNDVITGGLSLHSIIWVLTHNTGMGAWFPLTEISHMLDWQLYGPNAGGHHLTNVVLHAATAILLFLVLRKMTNTMWRSAFVAAVFAIHPLRVESVAWVTERKDVLSGFFFMLTLWAYVAYVRNRGAKSRGQGTGSPGMFSFYASPAYWLALLLFALGLLSKSMLVTVPFVLLLLDYWPLNRLPSSVPGAPRPWFHAWSGLILEKVPFLMLSAADGVATIVTQKQAFLSVQGLSYPWRVGNAVLAYVDYLGHLIYPVGLTPSYLPPGRHLPVFGVVWSALVLFVISAGVLAGRRKHPCLLVGWLWYLGMLLPVIDIMQAGDQARADRYTYLPQIGLGILVTWGVVQLCGTWRYRRVVLGSVAGVILALLLGAAYVQTSYWKDGITLWTHALACTPRNPVAHYNLGLELADRGKLPQAIQQCERALQLRPGYAVAHDSLGVLLAEQGKLAEAMQHFKRALELRPDIAETHYNFGLALMGRGKLDEAIHQFKRALQIRPYYAEARNDLGIALAGAGKLDEAVHQFKLALQFKPDNAKAHSNLGLVLARQGKLDEAIQQYERALQLKPNYAEVENRLGSALLKENRLPEAIHHFQQAVADAPRYPGAQMNLAAAWQRQGQIKQAIEHYQAAAKLEPNNPIVLNNLAWLLATSPEAGLRNGRQAVQFAERACQLTGYKQPQFIGTLAAAYAEAGRFEDAVAASKKAHDLALTLGRQKLALKNQELLELFKSHQPYREPAGQRP